jgi:hypothetical protein
MQLLAAVEGDGRTPLAEMLLAGLPRLRRGMTAVVITASIDRRWVRALTSLRGRGVAAVVISLDSASFERAARRQAGESTEEEAGQEQRALRFALAEYDLKTCVVHAGDNLGAVLA